MPSYRCSSSDCSALMQERGISCQAAIRILLDEDRDFQQYLTFIGLSYGCDSDKRKAWLKMWRKDPVSLLQFKTADYVPQPQLSLRAQEQHKRAWEKQHQLELLPC